VDEFDFHNSDLSKDVEIEVIVGDLGDTLEERFSQPAGVLGPFNGQADRRRRRSGCAPR
jgi:hypothetical protein